MKVFDSTNIRQNNFTAVTLGNFDGIHRGHQELIKSIKLFAKNENLTSVVFSFFPHPLSVIGKDNIFYTIFDYNEKKFIMENIANVDVLIQYPFTIEFASLKAEQFIDILFNCVKCKVLVVGEDYCFGKNRSGNYDTLKYYGDLNGVNVIKIPAIKYDGERVSSSRIRKCLNEGNIEQCNNLLNHPYFIMGEVVDGKKIGRVIGFPTVNIIPPKYKLLPPDGVYITKVLYNGKLFNGITNIGKNPTVGGIERTVETFLFDFEREIYGENIIVYFFDNIRKEIKFNSVEELKNQISVDRQKAIIKFKEKKFKL